ncbi:transglutaminase family protein [Derxia lacustris]|uniref:transglutaminase family protein n=1 Tax=Derxia lacustris TaxID=764842 RepID=UPI000A174E0A|nr:DUF3488 and transglutaminase-like domain-containing protein [Derxia lacustris]
MSPLARLVPFVRRQLATLGHDGRATLLLLLAVAAVVVPHFEHLPGWALAVTLGAFGWKCRLLALHRAAPPRLLLALIVGAIALGTWRSYGSLFGRDAGVTLLVMLMCLKLLEMQARRDSFVVAYLGFFLAATGFLFSQSIPAAACVLLALLLLLAAMVAGQLGAADPGAAEPQDGAGATGLRLAGATGLRLMAWSLPLAALFFLLFPRIPGPLWNLPNDAGGAHTGLSDSMAPGDLSDLAESGAMAFRARFAASAPAQGQLYWRALVMGGFDGRSWRPWHMPAGAEAGDGPSEPVQALSAPLQYELIAEPSGDRWLFALDGPLALGPDTRPTEGATWQARRGLRDRTVLHGSSALDYRLGAAAGTGDGPVARRGWLQLPAGFNPRTLDYGRRLRADYTDDRALIDAVLSRFRRDAYRYTLQPPRLGRDSVDEFLFDTRAGFCEHYASAFAVLMRAAGIPARVVAGYQGGEVNPVDGWIEVRQSDAHAWTEVWLGRDAGWVRIDPTAAVAPERIERGLNQALPALGIDRLARLARGTDGPQLWRALRHRWNAIENTWNLAVLRYDSEQQRSLFERLGLGAPDMQTLLVGCMAALGLASAALGGSLLWQALRRPRPDRLTRLAMRFEARLAHAGCVRAPHEPPAAFARRAVAALAADAAAPADARVPDAADQARRIFEALIGMRYRRPPSPAELEVLQRWIAEFKPRSPR